MLVWRQVRAMTKDFNLLPETKDLNGRQWLSCYKFKKKNSDEEIHTNTTLKTAAKKHYL